MTNGKSYTTSVWVRSQSGTPSAKVTLAVTANGSTSYVSLTPATAVNTGGWTLLTGTATVSWTGTLTGATALRRDSRGHRRPLHRRRHHPVTPSATYRVVVSPARGHVREGSRRPEATHGACVPGPVPRPQEALSCAHPR